MVGCIWLLQQEATSSLKLSNVAGIFYLLLCGIIIGVSMALAEFFYKTSVEARHRKVSVSVSPAPQPPHPNTYPVCSATGRPAGPAEKCCAVVVIRCHQSGRTGNRNGPVAQYSRASANPVAR